VWLHHKPQCQIIGIQRGQNVQVEGAKEPGGEQAKGRISQGVDRQRGEKARHPL